MVVDVQFNSAAVSVLTESILAVSV